MKEEVVVVQDYADKIINLGIEYAPKLLGGIIVLIVGLWISKLISKAFVKSLEKSRIDQSLVPFLSGLIGFALKALVVITVMGMVGVEMTSFVAIIGAAGLAVGLALSGTLQNFAGGVIILILKPFKIGDFIEAQNVSGTVKHIQIFVTQLVTANNQVIFIPNGALSNGTIINYNENDIRRTDLNLTISYETNIKTAKEMITAIINENQKVLQEPKPAVTINEITDSGIKIAIRVWAKNEDYWEVRSAILEKSITAFNDSEISFQPYVKEFSKK